MPIFITAPPNICTIKQVPALSYERENGKNTISWEKISKKIDVKRETEDCLG